MTLGAAEIANANSPKPAGVYFRAAHARAIRAANRLVDIFNPPPQCALVSGAALGSHGTVHLRPTPKARRTFQERKMVDGMLGFGRAIASDPLISAGSDTMQMPAWPTYCGCSAD